MKPIKIIILILLLINNCAISQNIIVDSIGNKPINSVHIQYKQNKGVITNEEGYFKLPNSQDIDTISLSHVLYEFKKIFYYSLKENDTIFLIPSIIDLDEVVLNNFKAKDTIIKAIKNINKNYLNSPHNLYGFFRQSLEENLTGVELIEVDFISLIKNQKSKTKIVNAKRTDNYSEFGMETYGGAAAVIKNGDFAKRKVHFLDIEKVSNYIYEYDGEVSYQDLNLYKISFKPRDQNNLQFIRKGTLYIDSKSLAFVEIMYRFDKDKLLKLTNQSKIKLKETSLPLYTLTDVENTIKYRKVSNDKWVLSYINAISKRKGVFKKEQNQYRLTAKLIINNVKVNNIISVKTNYNLSKDFSKAVKKYDNLEKWDDNYKLSLSNKERKILKDINEKKKNN